MRDLIFVILLVSLTCGILVERALRDGGTGWHIRTGQLILATHRVPRTDPFSVSTAGKPWYAWEWLADAALGVADGLAGLNGVLLLTASVVAATFAFLFWLLRRRGTQLIVAVALVLLAFSASLIHLYARPHVASWLLTLAWFYVLETARECANARTLAWLPLLMLFWVNVHGGFLTGFVLLAIYLADALWHLRQAAAGDTSRSALRWAQSLGVSGVLTGLVTFLNPYGYQLYLHIYHYLTDRFLMNHIEEFQSPNFHGSAEKCFVALLMLALVGVGFARTKPDLRHLLLLVFAAYSGLYASRNLPVSAMLIAIISGPALSQILRECAADARVAGPVRRWLAAFESFADRMGRMDTALRGAVWPVVVVCVLTWVAAHGGRMGSASVMRAAFDAKRFPVQAVDFMLRKGMREPVFSPDQWGGYLIYRGYPGVMVDDRHDLYGAKFFEQYLTIVRVEPGWDRGLEAMHAAWVLAPHSSTLAGILRVSPGWQSQYEDSVAVLFRKSSAAPATQPASAR